MLSCALGVLACWWLSLRLGLVLLSLWLSGFGFFPFPLLLFRATSQGTFTFGLWPRASRSSSRREGRRARRMGTDPSTGFFRYSPFTLYFLTQCPRQRTSAAVVRYVLAEGLFYNVCWWPSLLSSPFKDPSCMNERSVRFVSCFSTEHDAEGMTVVLLLFLVACALSGPGETDDPILSRTLNVGISTGTATASITYEIAFRHLCFLNAYFQPRRFAPHEEVGVRCVRWKHRTL